MSIVDVGDLVAGTVHEEQVVRNEVERILARRRADVVHFPEIDSLEGLNADQAVEVVGQLGHAYLSHLMGLLWEAQGHLPAPLADRIAIQAAYMDAAWRLDLRMLRGKV